MGRWFPAADRHARAPPRDHHTDRPGSTPIHVSFLRQFLLLSLNVASHLSSSSPSSPFVPLFPPILLPSPNRALSRSSSFPPLFLIIPPFLFVSLFAGTSHFTDNFPQFFGTFFLFFFFASSYFDKYFKKKLRWRWRNFLAFVLVIPTIEVRFAAPVATPFSFAVVVDASNVVVVTLEFYYLLSKLSILATFRPKQKIGFYKSCIEESIFLKLQYGIYIRCDEKLLHSGNIARYKY